MDGTVFQDIGMADELEQALWSDACLAAQVFAALVKDGQFQNAGIAVKAQAGPVRDIWMDHLRALLPADVTIGQIPIDVSVERLLGGLDLGRTLAAGRAVEMTGLLAAADCNVLFLPVAGLAEDSTVSLLAASRDTGDVRIERDGVSDARPARFGLICFDESEDADDAISKVLLDRLMLHIDLRSISIRSAGSSGIKDEIFSQETAISDQIRGQICAVTAAFGLISMRPAMQMVALTKVLAQFQGRTEVDEDDVAVAIRLSLVHRALQIPAPPEPDEQTEPEQQPSPPEEQHSQEQPKPDNQGDAAEAQTDMPDDMMLETVQASMPPGLLAYLQASAAAQKRRSKTGRRGAKTLGAKRGRPLTSRKGALTTGKRLDLVATLRAAAPWQRARRLATGSDLKVHVRKDDFHVRRYHQHSETSTIFVVDASGSTALNRLSEAKGAIEILLGESYARRDYVSLISFRGREGQVLLPPTRALVRAKRSLASLPGGGGTPLASGIQTALALAQEEWKRGRDPSIVLLTDGSANVDAKGQGGRKNAAEDAERYARQLGLSGMSSILVDIGRRPQKRARHLAQLMDAVYLPMPFADAKSLSQAVKATQ
ncbi:MAG: magnesium chelatase subunit D [Pseudomonadota bacterium]